MKPSIAASLLLGFGLTALNPTAQALSFTLDPNAQSANIGDAVSVTLLYDFSADPTLGGGVDLFYNDSVLQFTGFDWDAGFADDPDVRRLPDVLPGELNGLAFAEFGNGLSGPGVVGTFHFSVLQAGLSALVLAENDSPAGGFFSAMTFDPQTVNYGTAQVTAVPEADTWALLLAGLGLVGWAARGRVATTPAA